MRCTCPSHAAQTPTAPRGPRCAAVACPAAPRRPRHPPRGAPARLRSAWASATATEPSLEWPRGVKERSREPTWPRDAWRRALLAGLSGELALHSLHISALRGQRGATIQAFQHLHDPLGGAAVAPAAETHLGKAAPIAERQPQWHHVKRLGSEGLQGHFELFQGRRCVSLSSQMLLKLLRTVRKPYTQGVASPCGRSAAIAPPPRQLGRPQR